MNKFDLWAITTFISVVVCQANSILTSTKYDHVTNAVPVFQEEYFDQFIDHFNFNSHGNQKYKQRYLITGRIHSLFCCNLH